MGVADADAEVLSDPLVDPDADPVAEGVPEVDEDVPEMDEAVPPAVPVLLAGEHAASTVRAQALSRTRRTARRPRVTEFGTFAPYVAKMSAGQETAERHSAAGFIATRCMG